jgi:transcriptional antiterminator RfaH
MSAIWYVIHCKAHQEKRALENLERQAFVCYLPTLTVEKLRHARRCEVEEPLFPGYLFIHLDALSDQFHPIRSTRGVIQIVRFHEYPMAVNDALIEGIQQRLQPRVPYLQPGEPVRITEGAFADVDAIFLAPDGAERVVLLMNVLHREQRLTFPVSAVRKHVPRLGE